MHFNHVNALWLLGLIPLPLLLTRRRTPVARYLVSNEFLWRAAARRTSGSLSLHRVRRSSLVAIQMACIAAIVVALGGPVVTRQGGTTALVFDVSASMAAREDGVTRFDTARNRARTIVSTLPSASRLRLILAAVSPRETGTWNASDPRLASAIDALRPTAGSADIAAAIDAAMGRGGVDNVIVFTDTTRSASRSDRPGTPPVRWVHVGRGAENSAVSRVVANRTTLGGQSGDVLVVLKHFGKQSRETDVEISVDGRTASRAHVRLEPGRMQTLKVPLADLGHTVTARLVGADALSIDDVRSVTVPAAGTTRVALFGPRGSFLERALAANPSVTLRAYADDGIAAVSRDGVDVVVCDECTVAMPRLIPALVVANGGGQRIRGPLTAASVTHPLMASLDLGQQRAAVSIPATASAGADVILRVAGAPAVVASESGGRRTVEMSLDLSQPDVALTPAFPILIANVLEWLTAPAAVPLEATAGEPLTFSTIQTIQAPVRIIGPDGRPRDAHRIGSRFIVADTDTAGVYRIDVDGAEHVVAVNPSVDGEANLFASEDTSADQFGIPSNVPSNVILSEPVAIGHWMMLTALILLGFEWRLRMGSPA